MVNMRPANKITWANYRWAVGYAYQKFWWVFPWLRFHQLASDLRRNVPLEQQL